MYDVRYTDEAYKQLKKLDKGVRKLILAWIDKNLIGSENPWSKGKGLTGDRAGQWRYRIADYRLICDIREDELIILTLAVSYRKNIYKGF